MRPILVDPFQFLNSLLLPLTAISTSGTKFQLSEAREGQLCQIRLHTFVVKFSTVASDKVNSRREKQNFNDYLNDYSSFSEETKACLYSKNIYIIKKQIWAAWSFCWIKWILSVDRHVCLACAESITPSTGVHCMKRQMPCTLTVSTFFSAFMCSVVRGVLKVLG